MKSAILGFVGIGAIVASVVGCSCDNLVCGCFPFLRCCSHAEYMAYTGGKRENR